MSTDSAPLVTHRSGGCLFMRTLKTLATVGIAAAALYWVHRRRHRRGCCNNSCNCCRCRCRSERPSNPRQADSILTPPSASASFPPITQPSPSSLSPVAEEKHANEYATIAAQYATFRPHYPKELYAHISRYYAEHCSLPRQQAVDIGTGSGQNTVPLAEELDFSAVVGVDKSPEQVASARSHARVRYQIGAATETGLPSGFATLVTAAESAHWFDLPEFFKEAKRLLASEGVLALLGYTVGVISEPAGAQAHFETYFKSLNESPYWPAACKYELIANEFSSVDFAPFSDVQRFRHTVSVKTTVSNFLGYVRTFSALAVLRQSGSRWDPSVDLERNMLSLPFVQSNGGLDAPLRIDFPFFVVLASLPRSK